MLNEVKYYNESGEVETIINHDNSFTTNADNFLHSIDDKPACIVYGLGAKVKYYCDNGRLHRDNNEPALILHGDNNKVTSKIYYLNGRKHRLNGPAYIGFKENGNISFVEYYLDGIEYTEGEYKALIKIFPLMSDRG